MFYFLVSSQWKVDRQRVADLLVKASDDITCDPRQASNCVEKGEDTKTAYHPKIGVPALIFTLWLTEASIWNASTIAFRSGGAVAGEDILLHCSKEGEQSEFCLTYLQAATRTTLNEMRDHNHLVLLFRWKWRSMIDRLAGYYETIDIKSTYLP